MNLVHTKIRLDQLLRTSSVVEHDVIGFYTLFGDLGFLGHRLKHDNLRLVEFEWGLYIKYGKLDHAGPKWWPIF